MRPAVRHGHENRSVMSCLMEGRGQLLPTYLCHRPRVLPEVCEDDDRAVVCARQPVVSRVLDHLTSELTRCQVFSHPGVSAGDGEPAIRCQPRQHVEGRITANNPSHALHPNARRGNVLEFARVGRINGVGERVRTGGIQPERRHVRPRTGPQHDSTVPRVSWFSRGHQPEAGRIPCYVAVRQQGIPRSGTFPALGQSRDESANELLAPEVLPESRIPAQGHQDDRACVVGAGYPLVLRGPGHPPPELLRRFELKGRPANRIADQEEPIGAIRGTPPRLHHHDDRILVRGDAHLAPHLVQIDPATWKTLPPPR